MPHKFDFQNKAKLSSSQRKKLLPPEKLLKHFGLKRGDIFADFGAGTGYFTFPAAKIAGKNGIVYAIDISEKMLNEIENSYNLRKDKEKIAVIKTIIVSEENRENNEDKENKEINKKLILKEFNDNSIDFILASQVLHEVNNLSKIINEFFRILKNGGKLAIIEWQKISEKLNNKNHFNYVGPPKHDRLDPEILINLLNKSKFIITNFKNIKNYFYTITAAKNLE